MMMTCRDHWQYSMIIGHPSSLFVHQGQTLSSLVDPAMPDSQMIVYLLLRHGNLHSLLTDTTHYLAISIHSRVTFSVQSVTLNVGSHSYKGEMWF